MLRFDLMTRSIRESSVGSPKTVHHRPTSIGGSGVARLSRVVGWDVGGCHPSGIFVCGGAKLGPTVQPASINARIATTTRPLFHVFIPILLPNVVSPAQTLIRSATPRSDRAATPSMPDKTQRQRPPSPPRPRR